MSTTLERPGAQRASRTDRPGRRRGFTIFELLIVLLVIAVVASIAIPAFFERSEVTLDNACRLLAEDLRAAQNRAAFQRTEVRVLFDAEGDGYSVVDTQGRPFDAPAGGGPFVRSYSRDGVFEGVHITTVECPDRRIVYTPRGMTVAGGRIVVSYREDHRVVEVDPVDGVIHIPGLTDGWVDTGR